MSASAAADPAGPQLTVGSLSRKGATIMLGRTAIMRAVTALGTLVLARILDPADFGVYALLVTTQNVLLFVADFGIGASLVQQSAEPTRIEIATAWAIQQMLSVVTVVVIWIAAPIAVAAFAGLGGGFEWQLRLLSFSIAFALLRALPSAMLTRVLRFRAIATVEVVAHLVFYSTAVGLALLGAGSWSFAAALTLQMAAAAVMMNLAWRHWPGLGFDPAVARRLLRFGVAFQIANVAEEIRDAVVPAFGGLAGGVAAIGYLQFSLRLSQLTASMDEIIARVTFPAFSRLRHDAERTERVLRDVVVLVGLAIGAPQAWIVATAPFLVPFAFGSQWIPAVPVIQFMCVGVLSDVPARVAGSVVFGQGRARHGMAATLAGVGFLFVIFPILVLGLGIAGGGLAYAIAGALGLWLLARATRPIARFPWAPLLRVYAVATAAGLAAYATITAVPSFPGLILSAVAFGAVDLAVLSVVARADLVSLWDQTGLGHNRFFIGLRRRMSRHSA